MNNLADLKSPYIALGPIERGWFFSSRDCSVSNHESSREEKLFEKFPYLKSIVKQISYFDGDLSIKSMDAGIANHVFCVLNKDSGKHFALKIFSENKFEKITTTYKLFEEVRPALLVREIITPETVLFPCLINEKLVMVNEFLEGDHLKEELLPEAATLMGKLHTTVILPREINPRFDMAHFFDLCSGWERCAQLKQIWDSLDLTYMNSLPKGLIHGDFSYSNILVDKNNKLALIDCDKMRYSYLLDDIGLSQIYYGFDEKGSFKKESFISFMDAYQIIRPLAEIEQVHLLTHVKCCLIEVALIMHYYLYVHPDPMNDGVIGSPAGVERIKGDNKNHYIDPDFMALSIISLATVNVDFWKFK